MSAVARRSRQKVLKKVRRTASQAIAISLIAAIFGYMASGGGNEMSDTLDPNEFHPMAPAALKYVRNNMTASDIDAMSSCAMSGNRTAEICLGTAKRIQEGKPVSDRYVFGLAWFIKILRDYKEEEIQFSEIFDVKH